MTIIYLQSRLGDGIYVGHALTTYALKEQLDEKDPNYIPNKWQDIIRETIFSTRITYQVHLGFV